MTLNCLRFVLVAMFVINGLSTHGQIDTLYATWQNEQLSDSVRTQAAYKYIFDKYVFSDPDSAVILTDQLLAFTREREYLHGEAAALRLHGTIQLYQTDYIGALSYYEQSLAMCRELRDSSGISSALGNIGIVYGTTW